MKYDPSDIYTKTTDRPNIFLAAFFRCGSTHVKITLSRLLNYRSASTVVTIGPLGNDPHVINPIWAQVLLGSPAQIFHQHTLGTQSNQELLTIYKIRPIVMMRNILDSMVSVRELIDDDRLQHMGIYFPTYFDKLSKDDQFMWIAQNMTPWYTEFYMTWMTGITNILPVWYDEYYRDQIAGIRKILDHTGISDLGMVTDDEIARCSDIHEASRFKVGKNGRGRELMPVEAQRVVQESILSWGKEWGRRMVKDLIER